MFELTLAEGCGTVRVPKEHLRNGEPFMKNGLFPVPSPAPADTSLPGPAELRHDVPDRHSAHVLSELRLAPPPTRFPHRGCNIQNSKSWDKTFERYRNFTEKDVKGTKILNSPSTTTVLGTKSVMSRRITLVKSYFPKSSHMQLVIPAHE